MLDHAFRLKDSELLSNDQILAILKKRLGVDPRKWKVRQSRKLFGSGRSSDELLEGHLSDNR